MTEKVNKQCFLVDGIIVALGSRYARGERQRIMSAVWIDLQLDSHVSSYCVWARA